MTLDEIHSLATLDIETNNIIINKKIVSLFYFRAGDKEADYIDENSWKIREQIELSNAVKCPTIEAQLINLNLMQYYLQKPEVLGKYIKDEDLLNEMLRFFPKIYYTGDIIEEAKDKVFNEIKENSANLIAIPIGFNAVNDKEAITGDALVNLLSTDANAYIIKERITPPTYNSFALIDHEIKEFICYNEASIYGCIITDTEKVHLNKTFSFLLLDIDTNSANSDITSNLCSLGLPCLTTINMEKNGNPIEFN